MVPSLNKAITEDYARFRRVYFLQKKEQAKIHIENYLTWFNVQTGNKVKALLTDNGLEFDNSAVRKILADSGCEFRTAAPYAPEQNGLSERANRTIIELTRSLMISNSLPKFLWDEAVNCAVMLMNIVYTSPNTGRSLYEAFYQEKPNLARIYPFGTACSVKINDAKQKKWDNRTVDAILVGYEDKIEAYRVWLGSQHRVIASKNVVFPKQSLLWRKATRGNKRKLRS